MENVFYIGTTIAIIVVFIFFYFLGKHVESQRWYKKMLNVKNSKMSVVHKKKPFLCSNGCGREGSFYFEGKHYCKFCFDIKHTI